MVELSPTERAIIVEVDNSHGTFHVPLDIAWSEGEESKSERVWIEPGESTHSIECKAPPSGVHVAHLDRLLGKHEVK